MAKAEVELKKVFKIDETKASYSQLAKQLKSQIKIKSETTVGLNEAVSSPQYRRASWIAIALPAEN